MNLFLLSVIEPDGPMPPPEVLAAIMRDVDVFRREIKAAGAWVFNAALHPPSTATMVRVKEGEAFITGRGPGDRPALPAAQRARAVPDLGGDQRRAQRRA